MAANDKEKIIKGELITSVDNGGATMILKKFGNRILLESFRPEHWYGMRNAPGREDDVLVIASAKSVPFNGWEDHFLTWQKFRTDHPGYPIYLVRYEDLKLNPTEEIKKIAAFLQVPYTDKLCEEIAVNTSFNKMKKQKESLNNPFLPYYKDGKEIMYRQGKSGDWKNYFTTEEAEKFDKYYSEKLDKINHVYLQD